MLSLPTKKNDETICKWLLVRSSVAQKLSSDNRTKERFPIRIANARSLPYLKPKLTYKKFKQTEKCNAEAFLIEDANELGLNTNYAG